MGKQSILPGEMRGVAFFSGYRGIGKSFLAAQADLPKNIVFLDYENKGEGIDSQLSFGMYRAITQEAADRGLGPLGVSQITTEIINQLPEDEYTVLVLDNISPLELGLNAEAARNAESYAKQYGLNYKNIVAGRFGGTKSIVNFLIGDKICSPAHSKGIRLVIATSHIKPRWGAAGPIPNKFNMKGADRWQELSILTLVLIPGNRPPVPAALVQKEMLGVISVEEELTEELLRAMMEGEIGHVVKRRLPVKMPQCTFQRIRWYLKNHADLQNPAEGETPTDEESNPFAEGLSKEQIGYMRLALERQRDEEAEDKEIDKMALVSVAGPKTLAELKSVIALDVLMEKIGWNLPRVIKDVEGAWREYNNE